MVEKADYSNLYQTIGHSFNQIHLLDQAFTHSSVPHHKRDQNYERLEFLGDRVLGLVISDILFHRFIHETEGDLAKRLAHLVSKNALIQVAQNIQIERYLKLGRGVQAYDQTRRISLLADACEALIAALYLEGGLALAEKFVQTQWEPLLAQVLQVPQDAKSKLQEWSQERFKKVPIYQLIARSGPDHAPQFDVKVTLEGVASMRACAATKRQAEQLAAALLLEKITS